MIKAMLDLNPLPGTWQQPVIKTVATENGGVDELYECIMLHRTHLLKSDLLAQKRKERVGREIMKLLERRIAQYVHEQMKEIGSLEDLVEGISRGETDPYSCVDRLLTFLENK
jgi:LAO/AO transport system kinase